MDPAQNWPRPQPLIGDASSARQRAADPDGWAFDVTTRDAVRRVVMARRDIRRFRPEPVPDELLYHVLEAGHAGPSVGHSQPWRFIVVRDRATRDRAAAMADEQRVLQAAQMTSRRGQQLLDLKLEGLREAPVGLVVACDRRTPAMGVLGRATFTDADLWSCAAAIENMWLTARAEGLGMGWVTLFRPDELTELLGIPDGVETLGWLCVGWPDELPPSPGLERRAWSRKLPLPELVMAERWSDDPPDRPADASNAPMPQLSQPADPTAGVGTPAVLGPTARDLVAATDAADQLLSPAGSLGVLDRALDRIDAIRATAVAGRTRDGEPLEGGTLVLAGADHPVTHRGVSAFPATVTRDVLAASVVGTGMGTVAAAGAGLQSIVIDAGVEVAVPGARPMRPRDARGDLVDSDGLTLSDARLLLHHGTLVGEEAGSSGLVVLGEVGIGNTTVAAALACALLGLDADQACGRGADADADMVTRKVDVVARAVDRWRGKPRCHDPLTVLHTLGGGEFAVLTGVVLGAARRGAVVVCDGLAATVPALLATRMEPSVQAYLVAGQASREPAHETVLQALGLEPLLQLRLRSGEGVGGCLAASLLLQGQRMRRLVARTE